MGHPGTIEGLEALKNTILNDPNSTNKVARASAVQIVSSIKEFVQCGAIAGNQFKIWYDFTDKNTVVLNFLHLNCEYTIFGIESFPSGDFKINIETIRYDDYNYMPFVQGMVLALLRGMEC